MKNVKIGIIGAGPAGLTAAYKLSQKGHEVVVFESENSVGGMAKTIALWGQLVDLGPHRFSSSDSRINDFWGEIIGNEYKTVNRLTRIYYKNTFFDYPLKVLNVLNGLGIIEAAHSILSYVFARIKPPPVDSTFETWVSKRFGKHLFEIFFKPYSEKLWGVPCRELDSDFAVQRIKKLSLFEAIKAAVYGHDGKHRSLVDEFWYPDSGAGALYRKMAEKIVAAGGTIHLDTPVQSFIAPGPGDSTPAVRLEDGREFFFDHVVSSMPITSLIEQMQAPEAVQTHSRVLGFRNTILVYLKLNTQSSPFPDQWIYVHSPELQTGRITNFRNWVPTINRGREETILCLEYWCYDDDPIWHMADDALIELAAAETCKTGLVSAESILEGKIVRMAKAYPVYRVGYRKHLEPVQKYLSQIVGLSVVGRYGAFKYNNQDHSILMGQLAAENIADGKSHDLWKINTDYEYQAF